MNPKRKNIAAMFVGIVALLLPVTYVAAYLISLKPGFIRTNHFRDQLPPEVFFPYHWRDPRVGKLFLPLEVVDRRLRTSKWEDREVPVYIWSDSRSSPFE